MPKINRALKQPKVPNVTRQAAGNVPTDRVPQVGGRPEGEKSSAPVRGPRQSRGSNFRDFPRLAKQMGGGEGPGEGRRVGPRDLDDPQVEGRRAGPFRDHQGFVDKQALQHYFDKLRGSAERRLGKLQSMAERMGDRLIGDDNDEDEMDNRDRVREGRHRDREDHPYGKPKPFGDDRLEPQPQGKPFGDDRLTPQNPYGPPRPFGDDRLGPQPGQNAPNTPVVTKEQIADLKARIQAGEFNLLDELIRIAQQGGPLPMGGEKNYYYAQGGQ